MMYLLLVGLWKDVRAHKRAYLELAFGVLLVVVAEIAIRQHRQSPAMVNTIAPATNAADVKTVSLTAREVVRFVSDPKDVATIARLLAQLAAYKADAKAVVVSTARSESTGGGKLDVVASTRPPEVATVVVDAPPVPTAVHFADYRLMFDADLATQQATYVLTQRYETVVGVGRRKDGQRFALVQLYELDSTDDRVLVPTTSTTSVFADETTPHWLRALAVQGGLQTSRSAGGVPSTGGVVALQWLKHGRTASADEVTYAILSPAFVFGKGMQDIGLLPFSVNVGRLPHQPFSNLWVSPFVAKSQRVGVTLTATF